jgi:hypothetical protein
MRLPGAAHQLQRPRNPPHRGIEFESPAYLRDIFFTISSPDGTKPDRMTFREQFWKVWDERKYQLPEETDRCYMFELVTRNNRVVCKYDDDIIYCHGTRYMVTFEVHLNHFWRSLCNLAKPRWVTTQNILLSGGTPRFLCGQVWEVADSNLRHYDDGRGVGCRQSPTLCKQRDL